MLVAGRQAIWKIRLEEENKIKIDKNFETIYKEQLVQFGVPEECGNDKKILPVNPNDVRSETEVVKELVLKEVNITPLEHNFSSICNILTSLESLKF